MFKLGVLFAVVVIGIIFLLVKFGLTAIVAWVKGAIATITGIFKKEE
jgi:hypothetical protein